MQLDLVRAGGVENLEHMLEGTMDQQEEHSSCPHRGPVEAEGFPRTSKAPSAGTKSRLRCWPQGPALSPGITALRPGHGRTPASERDADKNKAGPQVNTTGLLSSRIS